MKKVKYFLYTFLKELLEKVDYLILLGTRSKGKSYAVKELALRNAFEKKEKFIYCRRFACDINNRDVESYFGDMPISSITNGKYSTVTVFRGRIYFGNINDLGKIERSPDCIGYPLAVASDQHYKSLTFPDVTLFIYEEFITNAAYLGGSVSEPTRLMSLISTVCRNRNIKVILIGNTISRICPYYYDWNLKGIPKQKPGTLDIYNQVGTDGEGEEYTVKIGVYSTDATASSKMTFGHISKSVNGTSYECKEMPHLNDVRTNYDTLYTIVMKHEYNMFLMEFIKHKQKSEYTWLISPKTTPIQPKSRVISSEFSTDPLYTNDLIPLNQNEAVIFNQLKIGKICYSDNLTGTEFEQILKELRLKKL